MARIAGVNLPSEKRVVIAITYIKGIGPISAKRICADAGISESIRVKSLSDSEIQKIREEVDKRTVEGELDSKVASDIKNLVEMGCYRGRRHRMKLPVRGQRTHTNARTRKGKAIAIAGKKK